MCTVSLEHSGSRLVATMNRDEALSRGPEVPPAVYRSETGAWMAPRDADRGGTWAGVNTHGVVACLLNAYLPGESLLPDTTGRFRSRGEIIPKLLALGPLDRAMDWIDAELQPTDYPSFTLIVGDLDRCYELEWLHEGGIATTALSGRWNLWSSSGWDSRDVVAWREQRFQRWLADDAPRVDTLPAFHLICEAEAEERSPLMRRSWAATRSITQMLVDRDAGTVELRYWGQPQPDSREPDVHLVDALACDPREEAVDTQVR